MLKLKGGLARRAAWLLAIGTGSILVINACGDPLAPGDLESTQGPLGQSCMNATPAKVFNFGAQVFSPVTYNPADCYKGYVVQVNNLMRGTGGTGGGIPQVSFGTNGGIGGQTACESSFVSGYVFEQQSDGSYVTQDALSAHGSWVPLSGSGGITGRCDTPTVTSLNLSEGRTYKFAATARTSSSSSAPTRSVSVNTGHPGVVVP